MWSVIFGKLDVVYADIAQPEETQIAIENCRVFLKKGGYLMLIVKSRSIDVTKDPRDVFLEETKNLQNAGFLVDHVLRLEPFDKDHAMIVARSEK